MRQESAHIRDLMKSLYIMAAIVEARDPYTGGHLWRVSQYARLLASACGWTPAAVARVALGGFLHDLGKVGVPDAILKKTGPLSDEEYLVIKTHPEVGGRLLSGHPLAELVHPTVFSHHETPNGRGYPRGLSGDAIPDDARLVGICDAFDAMTSTRPYRKGMPLTDALRIIRENLGSQFDRAIGERFLELGALGALQNIAGHSESGVPLQECPICGPTIVVMRRHSSGDHVYCRSCGGEAAVMRAGRAVNVEMTGRRGAPADLAVEIDADLIDELIGESLAHLEPGVRWANTSIPQ